MASPLITAASVYGSEAPQYTGSKAQTVPAAASGGDMETNEPPTNPIKALGIMVAVLVGIRFLFNAAKVV